MPAMVLDRIQPKFNRISPVSGFKRIYGVQGLVEFAKSLFKMVKSGKVKIAIDQRYPLAEAAQSHIDLEGRKTTGQTVLVP